MCVCDDGGVLVAQSDLADIIWATAEHVPWELQIYTSKWLLLYHSIHPYCFLFASYDDDDVDGVCICLTFGCIIGNLAHKWSHRSLPIYFYARNQ